MEACLQFEPSVFIIAVAYGLGPAMQYGRCARPLSSPHNTFALNLNLELGDYWMAVYRYDLQLGPVSTY